MVACFVLCGISLAILIYYIIIKCQRYDLKELFVKTLLSLLFVVLALIATFNSGKFNIFNLLVITGLVCGLIGDILLDLKHIDLERTVGYTYGGFVAFGLGHIMFITALIMNYFKGNALYIIFPILLDIVISLITILMEKPLKLEYGKMKPTVFMYALCLFGTFSFSLSLAIQNGFQITSLNMFLIGSVLFATSDLVLSGTYFGKDKERPIDFIMNYLTYYGAQYVIAFLLLFA